MPSHSALQPAFRVTNEEICTLSDPKLALADPEIKPVFIVANDGGKFKNSF